MRKRTLMKGFFDDVILQVQKLVQEHIDTLENAGHVLQV